MIDWQDAQGFNRGFLKDQFKIFYLKDRQSPEFEFHSHAFHKLIVFIKGDVTYHVEGISYNLEPWDMLLISQGEIHRPVINSAVTYERIIVWIHEETLKKLSLSGDELGQCFIMSKEAKQHRISALYQSDFDIKPLIEALISTCLETAFGSAALKQALMTQLMVTVNRILITQGPKDSGISPVKDPRIPILLDHINNNLSAELSIENLAATCYLSRYYLMHQFKRQTGFTLHQYIQRKRLDHANQSIRQGQSFTEAAYTAGFQEYSSFLRAYKKQFNLSPRQYHQKHHFDPPTRDIE